MYSLTNTNNTYFAHRWFKHNSAFIFKKNISPFFVSKILFSLLSNFLSSFYSPNLEINVQFDHYPAVSYSSSRKTDQSSDASEDIRKRSNTFLMYWEAKVRYFRSLLFLWCCSAFAFSIIMHYMKWKHFVVVRIAIRKRNSGRLLGKCIITDASSAKQIKENQINH